MGHGIHVVTLSYGDSHRDGVSLHTTRHTTHLDAGLPHRAHAHGYRISQLLCYAAPVL